ncbi:MAG: ATP-dependent DNA helicase RecG [Thermoanaerobaculia bacterium]
MSGPRTRLRPGDPVGSLPGVGPVRAGHLAAAGIETVGDLLAHLPHRYEDRREVGTVARVLEAWRRDPRPRRATLRGRLERVRRIRLRRRRLSLVRARFEDGTGALPVIWFNRPYLPSRVAAGAEYLLHGELRPAGGGGTEPPELVNPSCEPAEESLHAGRIVPVYPAAGELGPAAMRRLLAAAFDRLDPESIRDALPPELRARHGLPAVGPALREIHRPGRDADVAALEERRAPAHRRLVYGELLELQLALAGLRRDRAREPRRQRYGAPDRLAALARKVLPFRPTGDQLRALEEIGRDLAAPWPMLRLLQGDVGSGKTAVAAMALLHAVESGLQAVLMAPTELLAEQHHRSLRGLLGGRCRLGLVTASAPDAPEVRAALARGKIDLAVGTHALIQDGVEVPRLGLAVIDEQHRFGVVQRRSLQAKGRGADVLVMTATPIPRSLALTQYGELDLSVIAEMPPGRKPVATEVVPIRERREVYRRLTRALDRGERGYVVFSRIEDAGDRVPSLEACGPTVREWLGSGRTAVLHGGTDPGERDRTVAAFAAGEVSALLATTVVEVGVDVPEATWMVIEGAERFGLAQLHQLRGRVGRGRAASRCVAVAGESTETGRRRLDVFAGCTDGFRIAEEDLRIRGFGELLGTRQAGVLGFRVADPVADREWLERARRDAEELLDRLNEPGLAALRRRVERRLARRRQVLEGRGQGDRAAGKDRRGSRPSAPPA